MSGTMKVLQMVDKGVLKFGEVPIPTPGPNQILAKVFYAGQSPFDWFCSHIAYTDNWKYNVPGADFSGTVISVGSNVTCFKEGDRIAGPVPGDVGKGGSYAEYTIVDEGLAIKVPEHIKDEEAASVAVAVITAGANVFYPDQLGLEHEKDYSREGTTILVNGGSTSIGTMVIQFAKQLGIRTIVTASPRNFEFLKSIGASETVNYKDADAVEQIKKLTNDSLSLSVDCIAENKTTQFVTQCIGKSGGKISLTLPPFETTGFRSDVEYVSVDVYDLLSAESSFEIMGMKVTYSPEHRAIAEKTVAFANRLLAEKKLVPHPIKVVEGGLDGVEGSFVAGMEGRISAYKPVFRIDETKSFQK